MSREAIDRIKKRRRSLLKSELARVKEELIGLGAKRIVLFGSAARGEMGLFSDVDLLVVMDSKKPFLQRITEVYKKIQPAGLDILVYTPEEFALLKENSPFIRKALKEGELLYEKAP